MGLFGAVSLRRAASMTVTHYESNVVTSNLFSNGIFELIKYFHLLIKLNKNSAFLKNSTRAHVCFSILHEHFV